MYTNFSKVLANKTVFNAKNKFVLSGRCLKTNPVQFRSFEDTQDNRILGSYQNERKSEILKHWLNIAAEIKPNSYFAKYLKQLRSNLAVTPQSVFEKLVSTRQIQLERLTIEGLTNLLYLYRVHAIKDQEFETLLEESVRKVRLADASVSNIADILFYFAKKESTDEKNRQFVFETIQFAEKHLNANFWSVGLNGQNTMLYQDAPKGAYGVLENDVNRFFEEKGKRDIWLFVLHSYVYRMAAVAAQLMFQISEANVDTTAISLVVELNRLNTFVKAFKA